MNTPNSPMIGKWISRLLNADESKLLQIRDEVYVKRRQWLNDNAALISSLRGDDLERAYMLVLLKLGIEESDAPVVFKDSSRIIFHSKNSCPTLAACMALGLDTRVVCGRVLEKPTDLLVKRINPALHFSRNYEFIRPYAPFCEEIISFV